MKTKLLALAIAAATASGGALAAGLGADASGSAGAGVTDREAQVGTSGSADMSAGTQDFSSLDQDGDGQLSREEIGSNPDLADNWDRMDANQDGNIDQSEFSVFEEAAPGEGAPSEAAPAESVPGSDGGALESSPGMGGSGEVEGSGSAPGGTSGGRY